MGIGKRIKEAREHLHLTQKDLGMRVGVTASAITNYENETSHPKEPILYKLMEAWRCDAN
jgi:transcriptional regulator with XRE-family HTH domain